MVFHENVMVFRSGRIALLHIPCKVTEKTQYRVIGVLLKQCEHMSYFANIFVCSCFFRIFALDMQYQITAPPTIHADVALPPSKSISNRALIISALAGGNVHPDHLSDCDDTKVMVQALEDGRTTVDVRGGGTSMRFLTAYFAATEGEHVLTGTDRMCHRPIGPLVDALRYLGADITYLGEEGYPPLLIRGRRLSGGRLEIAGDVSSQYISALLMIAPTLDGGLELRMTGELVSRPYIDLTLWVMREYGADVDWTDTDTITVAQKPYTPHPYAVESDWSAAAFWYEILALTDDMESSVTLRGLSDGSKQGDSVSRYLFSLLGVKTHFAADGTVVLRKQPCLLSRMEYDFVGAPDLAQPLVVTCALRGIPFRFTGLASLHIKETDRMEALRSELHKLGFVVQEEDDALVWNGSQCEPPSEIAVDTFDDHRMAMSFAPAAIMYPGLRICEPRVVSKSYPRYWEDLCKAGFHVNLPVPGKL